MVSSSSVMMCMDSDASSEQTKDSLQLSTEYSPIGCSLEDQINYYRNKLMSTIRILNDKDEMCKIQEESLRMAELRIKKLNLRHAQLQAELNKKINETNFLQRDLEIKNNIISKPQIKKDNEITVKHLKNNLSVIEKLYRDCFYESARQEETIEILRKSFLEVRHTNTEKCDEICRLNNLVVSQKWDLDNCQDIAEELDSLKSEIANVLNNANNDSGMWERSEESLPNEISLELNEITEQLLQLKDILNTDCTCGLLGENKLLKREIEQSNAQLAELKSRTRELENAVKQRDLTIDQYITKNRENGSQLESLSHTIRESERSKEEQLRKLEELSREKDELLREREKLVCDHSVLRREMDELALEREGLLRSKDELQREKEQTCRLRVELQDLEQSTRESRQRLQETTQELGNATKTVENLRVKLNNCKNEINCKATDLDRLRVLCQSHESTINTLREELKSAQAQAQGSSTQQRCGSAAPAQEEQASPETAEDANASHGQLAASARRAHELEAQLAAARAAYDDLHCSFRNQSQSAAWLESELAEATSRGAELCTESRHVVSGVRHWMERMRHEHQKQQGTIRELQRRLRAAQLRLAALEGERTDRDLRREPCVSRSRSSCRATFVRSRCGMEGYTRADSSGGSSDDGRSTTTLFPSPPPPPPPPTPRRDRARRTPCRSCDAMRAATAAAPPSGPENITPEEGLMRTLDYAGCRFNSSNSQPFNAMRTCQSTRGHRQ